MDTKEKTGKKQKNTKPPVKKTDPDSSAVWRRIQNIKLQWEAMSKGGFE